ncbi:MAG TPA: DNA adenine methylase [Candidatus Angelobacter sp.]|jgi:DNA adenine methylase|nr:DNA adenine methylase [Candidatus Angelobacter sp.]
MESPFGWPGGKHKLKKTLLAAIPQHKAYVEVFSGSAKLLFAKDAGGWEIINDINNDLVNFFRVAKHRPSELAERLEHDLIAAARFAELKQEKPQSGEIERALQFAYLAWYSFGSKGSHFASTTIQQLNKAKAPVRRSLVRVRTLLSDVAERLRHVLVENRDFADCIRRYDSRDTFFYCDPPYTDFQENGRYKPLGERNRELFQVLAGIKGKFLLSYDDSAEIRVLCKEFKFRVVRVKVPYSLSNQGTVIGNEVLVSNYPLPELSS